MTESSAALSSAACALARVDLEDIASGLSDDARTLRRALAADDEALEEGAAARTVDDTLAWLRRRRARAEQKSLTQRLRNGDADVATLLREKHDRRSAGPPPPGRTH